MMLDLLASLPASLSCAVLGEWLSLVDVARLDCSLCNHARRSEFLSQLQRDELVVKGRSVPVSSQGLLWDWVLKRNIKLSQIRSEASQADEHRLQEYISKNGKHITHLCAGRNSHVFAPHCNKLDHLSFDMAQSVDDITALLQNNPGLRSLELYNLCEAHAQVFETFRLPHLTQLTVRFRAYSRRCFEAILSMTDALLKLEMWDVGADSVGVGKLCPHIRSLAFHVTAVLLRFPIEEFTSHCPHIVNLKLVDFDLLEDQQLIATMHSLNQLRSLYLKFDEACLLTDAAVQGVSTHCANTLESFSLQFCVDFNRISHEWLRHMRTQCSKVHTLRITGVWGSMVPLRSLTVVRFDSYCARGVLANIVAASCPAMQVLRLSDTSDVIPHPFLDAVGKSCPDFHTIELMNCSLAKWQQWSNELSVLPQLRVVRCVGNDHRLMDLPI